MQEGGGGGILMVQNETEGQRVCRVKFSRPTWGIRRVDRTKKKRYSRKKRLEKESKR